MTTPDYDDPDQEAEWCGLMRAEASRYLVERAVPHGEVGEWPAFRLAPHVAVFAIEHAQQKGFVGHWVVCGDVPTDGVAADGIGDARSALRAFALRWQSDCSAARASGANGEEAPGDLAGDEGIRLLENRARTLMRWAADDEIWDAN